MSDRTKQTIFFMLAIFTALITIAGLIYILAPPLNAAGEDDVIVNEIPMPEETMEEIVVTEEPQIEVTLPPETPVPTQEPLARSVNIWYEFPEGVGFGKTIVIRSDLPEGTPCQWYCSIDSEVWFTLDGETNTSLVFTLDETNNWYYWDLRTY